MNLVDSSGWLEYFGDGKNADFFAPAIEDLDRLLVSTINIYEVFKRVLSQYGESEALKAVAVMLQGQVVDVSSKIALDAAGLSNTLKLPMADSIILATARMHHAVVWTQGQDFQHIPGVQYIAKQ